MKPERRLLLDAFAAGLMAVNPRSCVARALQGKTGRFGVIAIGKAAGGMFLGACDALGANNIARGLVIGATDVSGLPENVICLPGAHPLPDERSLRAGQVLLDELTDKSVDHWLFLISGGSSAMVEVPVDGVSLSDLQRLYRWLLGSGWPISTVNAARTRVSKIKGGGLLEYLKGKQIRLLLMSDVPGDDAADIGSGLLIPGRMNPEFPDMPDWVRAMISESSPAEIPVVRAPNAEIIARNADFLNAVEGFFTEREIAVEGRGLLTGDAEQMGEDIALVMKHLRNGVYLWGGETTVQLPAESGVGGRNQQLALAVARAVSGQQDLLLLAAGTDGIDGNSEDAGALIDGGTEQRGVDAGFDIEGCLLDANANAFLDGSGDLIHTGATGTNVMDVVIALRLSVGTSDDPV